MVRFEEFRLWTDFCLNRAAPVTRAQSECRPRQFKRQLRNWHLGHCKPHLSLGADARNQGGEVQVQNMCAAPLDRYLECIVGRVKRTGLGPVELDHTEPDALDWQGE